MLTAKEKLLKEITDYYLTSLDYNGLPVYAIENCDIELLCQLIEENHIEVLSSDDVLNPHIKAFDSHHDISTQIERLLSNSDHCVLYPSSQTLSTIDIDYSVPYTAQMRKGTKQFEIVYFDIEILERYANNPIFFIADSGYRGMICPEDKYCECDGIDYEYIRDYGMAYIDGEKLRRAIGVFVCDLAKLSPKKQQLWKGFELEHQNKCHVHSGFIKNLILGEWVTDVWVFHAILDEMVIINKICNAISIPPLFNHTYGTHYTEKPEGYRNILLPTKKNYHDFVVVLEKLLVHNLSYKTFVQKGIMVKSVSRKDEAGTDKGSMQMLKEWLCINTSADEEKIQEYIINPLKTIRKIRQTPAHELTSNEYDIDYYKKQFDLVNDAYGSIRSIRELLYSHPYAKTVILPDYFTDGTPIVNY